MKHPIHSLFEACPSSLGRLCLLFAFLFSANSQVNAQRTRHFIVGYLGNAAPDRAGLFVAPLTDPEQISLAREAVQAYRDGGPEEVFRQWIEEGLAWRVLAYCDGWNADGLNRDYSRSGAPNWNWHVEEVIEISNADALLAGLNGTPWGMEYHVAGFYHPQLDLFQIGFWSYGPIGELPFPYEPGDAFGRKTSWIGTFGDDHYPWIHHEKLGWLWVHGFDPENVWMWSLARGGWLYTKESLFPWFWDAAQLSWRYWVSAGERDWFFNATTNQWSDEF